MMMSNLFFIFDPSLSLFSSSWFMIYCILIIPSLYFINSNFNSFHKLNFLFFLKEMKFSLPKIIKGFNSFLYALFLLILCFNFLALFPHLFSTTSHLSITLPLAYTLWGSIIIFNFFSFFKYFLSHFIPLGTPLFLMSFMVIVEILSNLIRPLALTFRLTANMMAGHLLMSLISNMFLSLNLLTSLVGFSMQFFLIFMEMGVSFIQAYVFFTLLLLYFSEGNHS